MRKLIICGSRSIRLTGGMKKALLAFNLENGPFEIVHGGAVGVDLDAHALFYLAYGIEPITFEPRYRFPGDREAPKIRNSLMAEYAAPDGACIGIPDPESRGTWDMLRKAIAAGLETYRYDMGTHVLVRMK